MKDAVLDREVFILTLSEVISCIVYHRLSDSTTANIHGLSFSKTDIIHGLSFNER